MAPYININEIIEITCLSHCTYSLKCNFDYNLFCICSRRIYRCRRHGAQPLQLLYYDLLYVVLAFGNCISTHIVQVFRNKFLKPNLNPPLLFLLIEFTIFYYIDCDNLLRVTYFIRSRHLYPKMGGRICIGFWTVVCSRRAG